MSGRKSVQKKRRAPARGPVSVLEAMPANGDGADEPAKRRIGHRLRHLLAVVGLWSIVILLWWVDVLRAPTSVAYLIAVAVVVIGLVEASRRVARAEDPWGTSRRVTLLLLLVLVPVAFDPGTVEVFNLTKQAILLIGAFTLVSLWLLQVVHDRVVPNFRNGLQWLVLGLLGWTVLTTATSLNPRLSLLGAYQSYDGLFSAIAFAIVFFAAAEAFTRIDVKTALSVFYFGGGGLTVLYGFFQLHDRIWGGRWDWIKWGRSLSFSASSLIWSGFGNPNHLAGFLAIMLPIGVVLFMLHRHIWVRTTIVAIAVLLVLELLHTTTRGAWLAALAALAILAVFMSPEIRRRPRVSVSVLGGLVAVAVAGAFVLGSPGQLAGQLTSIVEFDKGSTASQRTTFWKSSIRMANDRPLVGTGPDVFESVNPRYQTAPTNGAHNVFMSYLATQGYPALLLFLALLAAASLRVVGAFRRLRLLESTDGTDLQERAREGRLLLGAVAAGISAYLVQGSFDLQQIGLSFTFWALLGLLCVVARAAGVPDTLRPRLLVGVPDTFRVAGGRGRRRRRPSRHRRSTPVVQPAARRRRGAVVSGAMVTTAAVCIGGLSSIATQPYRADRNYRSAQVYEAEAGALRSTNRSEADRLLARSNERMERAMSLNPWEPRYPTVLGRAKFQQASQLPRRSPQQLAALEEARAHFRRAVTLAPQNASTLRRYARLLLVIHGVNPRENATDAALAEAFTALRRAVLARPFDSSLRRDLIVLEERYGPINRRT